MIRKDYLVRQFEEFGKVLATLLTLKKNQNYEEFEKELDQIFQKYSSHNLSNIENMTALEFDRNIISLKSLSFIEKKIIASLIYEKMKYYFEIGEDMHSENLKGKCIQLLQYLRDNHTENEFDLDIHYKLQQLKS